MMGVAVCRYTNSSSDSNWGDDCPSQGLGSDVAVSVNVRVSTYAPRILHAVTGVGWLLVLDRARRRQPALGSVKWCNCAEPPLAL